jgi:hypothetical protein
MMIRTVAPRDLAQRGQEEAAEMAMRKKMMTSRTLKIRRMRRRKIQLIES